MKSRGLGLRHVRFCAELKLQSAASLRKGLAASSPSGKRQGQRRGPFLRILECSAKPAASASDGGTNDKANRAHTYTHGHRGTRTHPASFPRRGGDSAAANRRRRGAGPPWSRLLEARHRGGAVVRAPSREVAAVGVCGAVRPGLHVRRADFGGGGGFFGHRACWTWRASTSEASLPPGRVLVPRGSWVSDPSHLTFLERPNSLRSTVLGALRLFVLLLIIAPLQHRYGKIAVRKDKVVFFF